MMARSGEEIREDLRIAASTATGFCHDAAMRLAGDFESLLAQLAALGEPEIARGVRSPGTIPWKNSDGTLPTNLIDGEVVERKIYRTPWVPVAASPTPTTEAQR